MKKSELKKEKRQNKDETSSTPHVTSAYKHGPLSKIQYQMTSFVTLILEQAISFTACLKGYANLVSIKLKYYRRYRFVSVGSPDDGRTAAGRWPDAGETGRLSCCLLMTYNTLIWYIWQVLRQRIVEPYCVTFYGKCEVNRFESVWFVNMIFL